MPATVEASNVAVPDDWKLVPQAIVNADEPLKRIINFCPLAGVPVIDDVIDVMLVASAVISSKSVLSVLNVGVAEEVIDVTRGVMRLFVRVSVEVRETNVSVVTAGNVKS